MRDDRKCPFNQPLVAGTFGCRHAMPITRRDGPDVACGDAEAHGRCEALMERLQAVALPVLGDDGGDLPHSATVKVMAGGLLGVQRLLGGAPGAERVDDVGSLVAEADQAPGGIAGLDLEGVAPDIQGYRLRKRRGR
jgi:hypothetical protein